MCSDVRAPTWPPSPQTFEAARRSGDGPRGWASRRLEMHTGAYPERRDRRPGVLDRWAWRAVGPAVRWGRARQVRPSALIRDVAAAEIGLARLDERGLRDAASALRDPLCHLGFADAPVARCFALVREAARRTIGQRHHDVQLVGGRVVLAGLVAEMETGEGKTLTATLAATTAALAGIPVHVVTVNDYLAARDAEWMAPVYRVLGLTVGVVVHGMDPDARRAAYGADVTYCTNKEVAFDYLRDRLVLGPRTSRLGLRLERLSSDHPRAQQLVLRGLHFAIVDEADSVLIDEARTPLVISGRGDAGTERRVYEQALELAGRLETTGDFSIDARERRIDFTERGRQRLEELARPLDGIWRGRRRREDLVRQALGARHLYHRDVHYLLHGNGRVVIVDEFTGRRMPDRSWGQDLHQLVEVKEGVTLTGRNETLARISYQRFFQRYLHLAGMTGTAREAGPELWSVYGLGVWRVPTRRPLRRRARPARACVTAEARWGRVVARAAEVRDAGRPVLIGTRSVAASERLSRLLDAAGLAHRVLNARQDVAEAETAALAGQSGRITVATNMAGRGTDITLGPGVADRGGLHVIATEYHEARRIDRQLFGRGGRQGDPGSFELIASLEDELMIRYGGAWRHVARWVAGRNGRVPSWVARLVFRRAQRGAERLHGRMRADLLCLDEHLETALAFSGSQE
jgi:preprotein translocase subunit SecA